MKARLIVAVLMATSFSRLLADQRLTAENEEISISMALRAYCSEYGLYPSGTTLDIIHALTGNNPQKIVFIRFDPKSAKIDGSILDPWGTPYRISRPNTNYFVEIRSAGPDKVFDSNDDIAMRISPYTAALNPWDHHDELKLVHGRPIDHRKAAEVTRMELQMLDSALDTFAVEKAKLTGAVAGPDDLLEYVPKGTRLYTALRDPNGPKDILGNPYGPFIVDQIPKVNNATYKALSDVAKYKFWVPYIEKR